MSAAGVRHSTNGVSSRWSPSGATTASPYKWVRRYEEGGIDGLKDLSRRPRSNPRTVAPLVQELVVELRNRRPRWGPRKLLAVLERDYPRLRFPAASTVGDLLRARGLASKRRRRRSIGSASELDGYPAPNAVWCADFKGPFLVGGTAVRR